MLDISPYKIVITSFLGHTKEIRCNRLRMHLAQRKILHEQFPQYRILSLCSGYTKEEKQKFEEYETYHITKPTAQHVKQNLIFKQLAKSNQLTALMVFDDDSVPDEENEFGLKPLEELSRWLENPEQIPASMVFFSGRGLLHDTYTNNRPPTVSTAPIRVAGPMFMVRSDFKINLTDAHAKHYSNGGYVSLDSMVRMEMAARGYAVAKHRGIFFKGSCKSIGSNSTISGLPAKRKEDKERTYDHITHQWPWLFIEWKGKNKRPLPIWQLRGQRLNVLLDNGALQRNEFGIVYPNPKKLKALYEKQSKPRPSLMELL